MDIKKYVTVIAVVTLLGALALGLVYSRTNGGNGSVPQGVAIQAIQPTSLTLNTVPYADSIIHSSLTIPTLSANLGDSYSIVGVLVAAGPNGSTHMNQVTGYNGTVYHYLTWQAELFIWNGPFDNGTTTFQHIMQNGGVTITETPSPPGVNSTRSAMEILAPTPTCVASTESNGATQTTCQTPSQSSSAYITKIGSFAVVVSPQSGTVTWLDDRNLRWYQISSDSVGISQLIGLAQALIT